jgi:hypothetical protein
MKEAGGDHAGNKNLLKHKYPFPLASPPFLIPRRILKRFPLEVPVSCKSVVSLQVAVNKLNQFFRIDCLMDLLVRLFLQTFSGNGGPHLGLCAPPKKIDAIKTTIAIV